MEERHEGVAYLADAEYGGGRTRPWPGDCLSARTPGRQPEPDREPTKGERVCVGKGSNVNTTLRTSILFTTLLAALSACTVTAQTEEEALAEQSAEPNYGTQNISSP